MSGIDFRTRTERDCAYFLFEHAARGRAATTTPATLLIVAVVAVALLVLGLWSALA